MPDPYDDPYGGPAYLTPPLVANDRAAAQTFLDYHRKQMEGREAQVGQVDQQQQDNIARMSKLLDETTAAIKTARANRSNLPMIMFGAGMLSTPGDFGQQLGGGLRYAGQALQQQRTGDTGTDLALANLAMSKAGLENAPLKEKLAYLRALQVGDLGAMRAIESSLIRSQGQNENREQQQIAKAVQDSVAEARRQFEAGNKEMYTTAEEAEAEINRLTMQQFEIRRAAGINIPQTVVDRVLGAKAPGAAQPGVTPRREAKGFTPYNNEQAAAEGLPPKPTAYIYDQIGPKQKAETVSSERKNWLKQKEDWTAENEKMAVLDTQFDRILDLINKNPQMVGRQHLLPNRYVPNISSDAQELESLFNNINVNNVVKGQGQVSNYERELFASANPNMGMSAEANQAMIGLMKNVLARRKDYRSFLDNYFSAYGTISGADDAWKRYVDSPVGSMVIKKDGKFMPNPNHIGWRDYFRKEHTGEPLEKKEGGAIRLDSDG